MKRIAVDMALATIIDVLVMLDGILNLIVQVSTATIRKKASFFSSCRKM